LNKSQEVVFLVPSSAKIENLGIRVQNNELTSSLFHRPPDPFIVPPERFVRFQLAYEADFFPSVLYFRGFESKKHIDLSPLKK